MKRGGIPNSQRAGATARLGHTDLVVVCGAGLPNPYGPEVVDLAFVPGVPAFGEVLSGLLDEVVLESATAAREVDLRTTVRLTICSSPACPS